MNRGGCRDRDEDGVDVSPEALEDVLPDTFLLGDRAELAEEGRDLADVLTRSRDRSARAGQAAEGESAPTPPARTSRSRLSSGSSAPGSQLPSWSVLIGSLLCRDAARVAARAAARRRRDLRACASWMHSRHVPPIRAPYPTLHTICHAGVTRNAVEVNVPRPPPSVVPVVLQEIQDESGRPCELLAAVPLAGERVVVLPEPRAPAELDDRCRTCAARSRYP